MSPIKMKPHHIGISVADLEEAISWYERHFGCKLESLRDFPEIEAKAISLLLDAAL